MTVVDELRWLAENGEDADEHGQVLRRAADLLQRYEEALREIAVSPHANQGWCYEPHGTRPCSCHVADARKALADGGGE